MGLWKKRRSNSEDIIDLTLLQKRGILQRLSRENSAKTQRDIVDFTKTRGSESPSPASLFDALNERAVESAQTTQSPSAESFFPSFTAQEQQTDSAKEVNQLKIKIDDIEYKFSRLLERLQRLEAALESRR